MTFVSGTLTCHCVPVPFFFFFFIITYSFYVLQAFGVCVTNGQLASRGRQCVMVKNCRSFRNFFLQLILHIGKL